MQRLVVDIKNADEDKLLHGEKGAELASISSLGINIPQGFIITTEAYFEFIEQNNLRQKLNHLINAGAEKKAKKLILESVIPKNVFNEIFKAYRGLGKLFEDEFVTLNPSITDTNYYFKYSPIKIKGEAVLLQSVKEFWASYFDEENFLHRQSRNMSHFRTGIAILIQKDLKSDKTGSITADKGIQIVSKNKINEKESFQLLDIGQKIASLHYFSKKINWIIANGKIYVTDIGPSHYGVSKVAMPEAILRSDPLQDEHKENKSIGGIATGVAKIIDNKKDILSIKNGDVVIISSLKDYDQLKSLKRAKAVVVNSDIENQHIKMVLSQMGFPVVMGIYDKSFRNGMIVTVDARKGKVYQGEFKN